MCLMGSALSMRACVRKCAGIPLSVKKMKGREQKVVFMREVLLWEREIKEISPSISIKLFHISPLSAQCKY